MKINEKFGKFWKFSGASPKTPLGALDLGRGLQAPCNPLRQRLRSQYPLIPEPKSWSRQWFPTYVFPKLVIWILLRTRLGLDAYIIRNARGSR